MLCRLRMGKCEFGIMLFSLWISKSWDYSSPAQSYSFSPSLFTFLIVPVYFYIKSYTVHFCLCRDPLYPGVLLELEVKIFNIESQ